MRYSLVGGRSADAILVAFQGDRQGSAMFRTANVPTEMRGYIVELSVAGLAKFEPVRAVAGALLMVFACVLGSAFHASTVLALSRAWVVSI